MSFSHIEAHRWHKRRQSSSSSMIQNIYWRLYCTNTRYPMLLRLKSYDPTLSSGYSSILMGKKKFILSSYSLQYFRYRYFRQNYLGTRRYSFFFFCNFIYRVLKSVRYAVKFAQTSEISFDFLRFHRQ